MKATVMSVDIVSLLVGLSIAGLIGYFFSWSENGSLTNRLAYLIREKALDVLNNSDKSYEDLLPNENRKLIIRRLADQDEWSGVHYTQNFGVYSKEYGVWLVVETSYDTYGDLPDNVSRYLCTPQTWHKTSLIQQPYTFDINRHFIRAKSDKLTSNNINYSSKP